MNELVVSDWLIIGQVWLDLTRVARVVWEVYESEAEWKNEEIPSLMDFYENEYLQEEFFDPTISFLTFGDAWHYASGQLEETEIEQFFDTYSGEYGTMMDEDFKTFLLRHHYFFTHNNDFLNNPFVVAW